MSIKQQLMKRMAAVNIDQLSDEEFAKYLVDSLGLKACAWILEDFFWESGMAQGEPDDNMDAMLKPFGLRFKHTDEYTDEELEELEADEIYEIATNEYVGCTDCRAIGDIADSTYERANDDNMAQALVVCMNINKDSFEKLATKAITNQFQPSTAVASNKKKTARTADVATDQLNNEEFAKYLVDSLGLKTCAWMLEDFFWEDESLSYGSPDDDVDTLLKPFGLRVKRFEEYTDEESENKEIWNYEIVEIGTNKLVGATDCTGEGDIANNAYSRANDDNMAQALIACMNIDRELVDALAADALAKTFNPRSTVASKAGK